MSARLRSALLVAAALFLTADSALAAAAASAVALPDTGLFAPVAAQFAARVQRELASRPQGATADRVRLLLATGRADEAATLSSALAMDTPDARSARGRALLARLDFAALATVESALANTEEERSLRYALMFARDDAAGVDRLTRDAASSRDDAERRPELMSAARLAYDQLKYTAADSLYGRVLA
ncbi:MAG: hypothetical protein IT348_05705, partial [Candidatus Eisenbacteria bacterium]|nr:hypothetical protein [Candidatus Eisenbacteria bacterium]